MNIYFDESRNTGEIGGSENKLNFEKQRYFVLAGLIEDKDLIEDYKVFKEKWLKTIYDDPSITEIKGNDLMPKERNVILSEFIEKFMSSSKIYVTIYDKKFFLTSQFLNWLFAGFRDIDFTRYHLHLLLLQNVNEEFIIKYLDATKNNSLNEVRKIVEYVKNYSFSECIKSPMDLIILKDLKQLLVMLEQSDGFYEFLHESNSENIIVKKAKRNNIVNLTALGETVLIIKKNYPKLNNEDITVIHDKINVVQEYIKHYWKHTKMDFVDSKNSLEVQLADNISSIFGNLISKILPLSSNNNLDKLISDDFRWIRDSLRSIYSRVDHHNIKMVINMREAALLKSYISENEFNNTAVFSADIMRRLDSRFNTELKNHLNAIETRALLKR